MERKYNTTQFYLTLYIFSNCRFAVKDPKRTKTKDERFSIPNAPEESNVPVPDLLTSKNGSVSKRNKPGSRGIWKRLSGIFRKSGNKGDPCKLYNKTFKF